MMKDVGQQPYRTKWTYVIHVICLLTVYPSTGYGFKQQGTCYFPERWEGVWFQSGVRASIIIEGPRLSTKGRCLGSDGDKFLMVDEKACYRCVVIHEKHENVLQYKETFCHGRDALPTLCSLITGDALLYSLFRENATPVICPFRGPFTFTYNRGHGECRSPVSNIDTCTEDSKLLLSYQACPDIYGSESTVEELQCLASWKEGSVRYLVGQIHHHHVTSNEDRFRCFVYEKTTAATSTSSAANLDSNPLLDSRSSSSSSSSSASGNSGSGRRRGSLSGGIGNGGGLMGIGGNAGGSSNVGVDYRVAQSGDATCNGLFSAFEGSRTMTLRRAPQISKCHFPSWIANYNHWHTLDYTATYSFHHRNSTLRISNSSGVEMKVVCVQVMKHNQFAATTATTINYYYSNNRGGRSGSGGGGRQSGGNNGNDDGYVVLITHFTMGCQSGFTCMSFYRRDGHVAEIQIGSQAKRPEDACNPTFFNRTNLPYVTLVVTNPPTGNTATTSGGSGSSSSGTPVGSTTQACPYIGKFDINNFLQIQDLSASTSSSLFSSKHLNGDNSYYDRRYKLRRRFIKSSSSSLTDDNDYFMKRTKRINGNNNNDNEDNDDDTNQITTKTRMKNNCDNSKLSFTNLIIGCNKIDTMEFITECSISDLVTGYTCNGRWEENGTNYLITTPIYRNQNSLVKKYCFIYKELNPNVIAFSISSFCNRLIQPGVSGDLVFNITNKSQCQETNSSHRTSKISLILIFVVSSINYFIS